MRRGEKHVGEEEKILSSVGVWSTSVAAFTTSAPALLALTLHCGIFLCVLKSWLRMMCEDPILRKQALLLVYPGIQPRIVLPGYRVCSQNFISEINPDFLPIQCALASVGEQVELSIVNAVKD